MGSFLSIDARSSRELQAVLLAIKQTDKTITKTIRAQSKQVIVPAWKDGLEQRAVTTAEKRLLAGTGRAAVSDSNVKLVSGGVKRKLSNGLSTAMETGARAVEFGANRAYARTYQSHSRKGTSFTVKRHTQRQLRSGGKGYVVYPTAEKLIPRIASLWIQTVVRAYHEAFESR